MCGLFRTKPKLVAKVLIRVATVPDFGRRSTPYHKANDDLLHSSETLELGIRPAAISKVRLTNKVSRMKVDLYR